MCIEGYPDRNVPTLLLYRGGQLVSQAAALGKPFGLRPPLALQGPLSCRALSLMSTQRWRIFSWRMA